MRCIHRSIPTAAAISCLVASACMMPVDEGLEVEEDVGVVTEALSAFEVASFQNLKTRGVNVNAGCVGVDGASTANGALIKQFACDGRPNQNWRITRSGILHTMTNVRSSKCMGVDRASTNPGANIAQFGCDGRDNQQWVLEAVGGTIANPIVVLHNANSSLCIGIDRASTANGAQLKQFRCDGAINQKWRMIER